MEKTSVTVKVDLATKKNAEEIFSKLGLNMTTAINTFLKAVERYQGLPFALELREPNRDSLLALQEVRERYDELKTYNSFAEFIADINEEMQSEN